MLNAISGAIPAPAYTEAAESAAAPALPPYTSHPVGDTLFRCQSRPRHDTRADAVGYGVLGAGAVLALPTVGISLIPAMIYYDMVALERRPKFLKISRHLFFCVGAVATRERSEAIVDALVETGALQKGESRGLRNASAFEAALNVVKPDAVGVLLSESEKNAVREAFQIFLAEAVRHQNLAELRDQTVNRLTRSRSAPPACLYPCDDSLVAAIDKEINRLPSSRGPEMPPQNEPRGWA